MSVLGLVLGLELGLELAQELVIDLVENLIKIAYYFLTKRGHDIYLKYIQH